MKTMVSGHGTVGKRVADTVVFHSDVELIDVAKTHSNFEAWMIDV